MDDTDISRMDEVSEIMNEAAQLHLRLEKHSSIEIVATAIQWRFGVEAYVSQQLVKHALKLLDAMPKKR